MLRGPLAEEKYKPSFSGHETFPLRYGWLRKAYEEIKNNKDTSKNIFSDEEAVSRFGVGKNMVAAIHHWSQVTGIVEEDDDRKLRISKIGDLIFSKTGDPYLEHMSSLWFLHWLLATNPKKTTWFWAFNHFPTQTFSRDQLVQDIIKLCSNQTRWRSSSANTIKRDVDCFVRTYSSISSKKVLSHEENLESPLSELGIISALGRRDIFRFSRGEKPTLSNNIFLFSLIDFWIKFSSSQTMTFEKICYEPGSPGRVFMFDEDSLTDRLANINETSNNLFKWSETAGLKQIICETDLKSSHAFDFLKKQMEEQNKKRAA